MTTPHRNLVGQRVVRSFFGVLAGCAALRLTGQEVLSGPAIWAGPLPAPEVLPKGRVRPDYPSEAKHTDEIGYAMLEAVAAPDGRLLSRDVQASEVIFARAVEAELVGWEMKPGQMAGKPIYSPAILPFIFNPRSASDKGPDATPRLLAVTPIFVGGSALQELGPRHILRVRIHVDETGAVTGVEFPAGTHRMGERVRTALKSWKFAPARQAGLAVAATVELNAVAQRIMVTKAAIVLPREMKHSLPPYPEAMRWSRMRGQVTLNFIINARGETEDVTVAESNNPGFEDAAIKAAQKWRYQPGTRDGQPVPMHWKTTIHFDLERLGTIGSPAQDAYSFSGNSNKLPPEYRYDVAPTITGMIEPVYPYNQLLAHTTGDATVAFVIGVSGRVVTTQIAQASLPEFGQALEAAVSNFRFDPALRQGKPVETVSSFHVHFNGLMYLPSSFNYQVYPEFGFARDLAKHPEELGDASHLDAPLRPISRRAAVFPPNLKTSNPTGRATVRFIVDEDGHVRIPQIVSSTAPEFGYAAVQAAQYWRFDPPKIGGKTAMVRVEVPFTFKVDQ